MFYNTLQKIRLSFHRERELCRFIRATLGYYPRRVDYYREAFTHRSASSRGGSEKFNNERLEFLGDAILDAAVADILYKHFPDEDEGFLTNTRSKIVQREHLNRVGQELGLHNALRCAAHSHSHNSYIYGNALEALIGAIYLDQGYRKVKAFVTERIIDLSLERFATDDNNYKSRLIEWAQKNKKTLEFELLDSGLDQRRSPIFTSAVIIDNERIAEGTGYSKKESHQAAAQQALNRLGL